MARPQISVSKALPQHLGEVSALWIESAVSAGMSRELASRAADPVRLGEALQRPGTTVVLARLDDAVVGFAVVNTRQHGLLDAPALAIDDLFVLPDARRQGVAAQLLIAVATVAESEGHDLVFADVAAADKGTNRYFARLGFGTAATRRVVPTSVLRRKLCAAESVARDVLLGKRRTIRARARVGATPAPVRGLTLRRSVAG